MGHVRLGELPRTRKWDQVVELIKSDGDKVVGAFCGEPFPREVVWMGDRYETYDPDVHTGSDTRTEDREAGARSTVQRWLADQPATGYGQFAAKWPDVAMAIDEVTASGLDARMRALAAEPAPEVTRSLEETTAALEEVIRNAPLPRDREMVAQIHSIKRRVLPSGKVSFDAERTGRGHADRFWAIALACQMERGPAPSTGTTIGVRVIG